MASMRVRPGVQTQFNQGRRQHRVIVHVIIDDKIAHEYNGEWMDDADEERALAMAKEIAVAMRQKFGHLIKEKK